ncbi:cold shock domain-containing protein [Bacillus sp. UNC437CL72CviS29]|uniref:cold shock domain-containing protein n=1 Tax=Bacillus sp. UNC437CL72CviS29 TaxID=1340430 RepID=UPI00047A7EBF|nr:cold shock domain-containing protein [Bacillus sp. UNC437CL72CviS29]
MKEKCEGIVEWFKQDEGYGSILIDGKEDSHAFVHFSSIAPDSSRFPDGFRYLLQGQRVSFHLIEMPKLNEQSKTARNVVILSN